MRSSCYEYLKPVETSSAIRSVGKAPVNCRRWERSGIPPPTNHVKLMFDLQVFAISHSPRDHLHDGSRGELAVVHRIGVPDPHHPLIASPGHPRSSNKLARSHTYHVKLFAYS